MEPVHPRAPAARILPPQDPAPTRRDLPLSLPALAARALPSRLLSFSFLPHPTPTPALGRGAPAEEGATESIMMGEGDSRGAPPSLQPQPPQPHDLHGKGAPSGGGEDSEDPAPGPGLHKSLPVDCCALSSDLWSLPWTGRFLGPVCDGRLPTRSGTCGLPAPTGHLAPCWRSRACLAPASALCWCLLGSCAFLLWLDPY